MLAVVGFEVGFLVATGTTTILSLALGLVNHGGGDDTCRHSDDGVTQYHDERGKEATDKGYWGDVTITDGGEGDDGPIDTGADICELGARLSSLNDEHQRAKNGDEDENEEEIDKYLPDTEFDALQQQVTFVDEGEELEHAENADESEDTQDEEIACGREIRDEGEIEGKRRHEVDDAKETEGIIFGSWGAVESEDVLDGEEEGEDILHDGEHILETSHDSGFRLDECDNETEDNRHHHDDVEHLACLRVGIEHDVVESWLIFEQSNKLFHATKLRIN